MKDKNKEVLNLLIDILKIFKIKFPNISFYDLYNELFYTKKLDLLNENGDLIGTMINCGDYFKIETLDENMKISSTIQVEPKEIYRIKIKGLNFQDDSKISMSMDLSKAKNRNFYYATVRFDVGKGHETISSGTLSTKYNRIFLKHLKTGEYISYVNRNLSHVCNGIYTELDCDLREIYYKRIVPNPMYFDDIKLKDNYKVNKNLVMEGGYEVDFNTFNKEPEKVEEEYVNIINDIDLGLFDFVQSQKELINSFSDNLFENLVNMSLVFFTKRQICNLLGINLERRIQSPIYKKQYLN